MIPSLLARDLIRAVFDAPWQTAFIALAGWGAARLFDPRLYGAWLFVWPITLLCCAILLFGTMGALSEPGRTSTFLPMLALSATFGGLMHGARSSLVAPLFVTALAIARHALRRRSLAPSFALLAFAAVITRAGLDALARETRPTLELLLASYAWFALLLVAFPDQATRGSRRLFGLGGLAVAGSVVGMLHTSQVALALPWAAVATIVFTSIASLRSAIEARPSEVVRAAYR